MTDAREIVDALREAQIVEEARAFLDKVLARQDLILTPERYYATLANLVASVPPFKRPKFHVRAILEEPTP